MFNAEEYTISVRKERMDGDVYWVARVEELPDIMEFGDTREDAYNLAIDTLTVGQEMCLAEGTAFPAPKVFQEPNVSGRITLRLPKSVHANCIRRAEEEEVSLNSYILTCITSYRSVQESNFSTSLFEDFKRSVMALANPRGHLQLLEHAGYAYSKKGHFNVVVSNTDTEEFGVRALNAQSAFRDINLKRWDVVSPC
ncbi:type II toxin-antitoxin system HicB family antitoxin [Citrobacter portucalensis]|uniref:type II toxin-antitoxin system HicB family antitoxin n=1 Tax=Citrobacter portucalensis TaxID=1639133 RepID=UPI000760FFFF|nr:type II toxin-antitoxin system HicB family antitoxin [Citrobacter portucalensis]MBD9987931.1 type II toxin-antitoxin system HicB family antitoxin [Citrobacter portucalensis]MBE0035859.1 type II toxin-antitoxin system HicB family antitoxin [Citrobacter portucalensis]MBE0041117.1 type II toxin-antitoxin system HicB family antitoxin [Citrobacter portucalensis]MBE0045722.1 type II toxin-antitoxin system HicB family antitoxin [Citrobacter portucalensis]MBE0079906.1 type II toxin-antitoxin system